MKTESMGAAENPTRPDADPSKNPFMAYNTAQDTCLRFDVKTYHLEQDGIIGMRLLEETPGYNKHDIIVAKRFPTPGHQHVFVPDVGICDLLMVFRGQTW